MGVKSSGAKRKFNLFVGMLFSLLCSTDIDDSDCQQLQLTSNFHSSQRHLRALSLGVRDLAHPWPGAEGVKNMSVIAENTVSA
jgi:hypothetical protein